MLTYFQKAMFAGICTGAMALAGSGNAATVTVDGTPGTYETLSAAVSAAIAADDGPHTINITTNTLATSDTEVVISEPMTIEGDADADGVSCDILVDNERMQPDSWVSPGYPGGVQQPHVKTYLELNTSGTVTINNLNLHPNHPGIDGSVGRRRVNAIRMYIPMQAGHVGNYVLNNVRVSGSNENREFVDIDTNEDLYNTLPYRWSNGPSYVASIIVAEEVPADAQGSYNVTLNNCHAGVGNSGALSIQNTTGKAVINGGMYGHVRQNGILLDGTGMTVTGSPTNRTRVTQVPMVAGGGHGILVGGIAQVDLLEYADVLTTASSVNINVLGGTIDLMRHVRGLGKADNDQNTMHVTALGTVNIEDSTLHGSGFHANPFQVSNLFDGSVTIKDSIFTSDNFGFIRNDNDDLVGLLTISNSAISADGVIGESLNTDTPTTSPDQPSTIVLNNNIALSPLYILPASAYDWSDDQGASDPLNGPGNRNVLRPSNPAYLTASSTGGAIVGGAGPIPSGIDPSLWMLMD